MTTFNTDKWLSLITDSDEVDKKKAALNALSMMKNTITVRTVEVVWQCFISETDSTVKGAAILCLGAMVAKLNDDQRSFFQEELRTILKNRDDAEDNLRADAYNCILVILCKNEIDEDFERSLFSCLSGYNKDPLNLFG